MQIVHIPKIALFLDFSSLCNFAKKKMKITLGFVQHIYFKVLLKKILKMVEKTTIFIVCYIFFLLVGWCKVFLFLYFSKEIYSFQARSSRKKMLQQSIAVSQSLVFTFLTFDDGGTQWCLIYNSWWQMLPLSFLDAHKLRPPSQHSVLWMRQNEKSKIVQEKKANWKENSPKN